MLRSLPMTALVVAICLLGLVGPGHALSQRDFFGTWTCSGKLPDIPAKWVATLRIKEYERFTLDLTFVLERDKQARMFGDGVWTVRQKGIALAKVRSLVWDVTETRQFRTWSKSHQAKAQREFARFSRQLKRIVFAARTLSPREATVRGSDREEFRCRRR